MRGLCCRRDVRGRAHSGLIAEQPAFYTLHHCRPDTASNCLLKAECTCDYSFNDIWYMVDVHCYDKKRKENVP